MSGVFQEIRNLGFMGFDIYQPFFTGIWGGCYFGWAFVMSRLLLVSASLLLGKFDSSKAT